MADERRVPLPVSPRVSRDAHHLERPTTPVPEKWFRKALFHSNIGVAIIDNTGHFIQVNEAYCRITGYTQDELASLDWVGLTHPGDREHNVRLWQQMYAGELPGYTLEERYIKKDGTAVWVRNTVSLFREDSSKPDRVLVLVEDIDARKRMEELVAEVHRLAQIGVWEWDLATDAVTWSDEIYGATGYDPTKPPPKLKEQFHLFTPESWERVSRAMEDTLRTGVPYELDLEVILPPDGRKRLVIARGEAVKNSCGQIARLRGTIQDVTERRQREEAARDSEQKFATTLRCSPHVFTLCTVKEDRYLDVNEGFERTFGYTRQEVIGHTTEELGIWEDRTEQEKLAERARAGERIQNAECRFRKKNGEIFTGLLSGEFVDIAGEHCVVATVIDITEWERIEEARRAADAARSKSEEKLAKFFHMSPIPMVLVTAKEGRQIAVNEAYERLTGYSRDEAIGRTLLELGHWEDPRAREKVRERILAEGSIRNVECRFRNKRGELIVGLLSAEVIDVDGESCLICAVADITNWKRVQEAVKSLQAKLALHFEQTLLGVIEWDREGRVNAWNPAAEDIFGYTRAEALGRRFRELIVPKELFADVKSVFRALLHQTGGRFTSHQNVTKDGRRIVCEWVNTPLVAENGEVIGIMSLVRDITAEHQVRSELAASQATLSCLINSTDDMIWTVDAERFGFTSFNTALASYFADLGTDIKFGMTPEDISKEHASEWDQAYARARDMGVYEFEYVVPSTDRRLQVSLNPLVHDGRVFGVSAFGRDITESRRADRALRQNEERLRFTLEATSEGVWDWNIPSGKAYFSPRYARMLGYEPEEFPADYAGWKELVHPEDFDRVDKAHAAHIHNREEFCVEFRMRKKAGGWCWIRSRGAVIERDADDRAIRMVGTHLDITERKQTEEALRASEARYRNLVESSHDWVWEVDAEGIYTFVGPQCEKILGYAPDELIGKRPFDLMPPEEAARVAEVFGRISAARKPFRMLENGNLHKDGNSVVLETNGVPFFDTVGKFLGYRGMDRDITARKRAEEDLRQSERKFATLFRAAPPAIGLSTPPPNGKLIDVNDAFETITGYTREEAIGRTVLDLGLWVHPQDREQLARELRAGGSVRNLEHVFRTKAGELRSGRLAADLIEINGEQRVLTVVTDITEHRKAEDALRASEEKFRSIAENLPGVVYQFYAKDNGEWGVHYVHERARGVLGISAGPLETWRRRFHACLAPGDREHWEASIQQAVASAQPWESETRFIKPTGEEIYIRGIARPRRNGDKLVYYGILLDITDRKRAEAALRESEARLRLAAAAGRMYAFDWDPATDVVHRSPECVEILGMPPTIISGKSQEFVPRMDRSDREQYLITLVGLSPESPCCTITYCFLRPDGATIWLEDRLRGFFDERGTLLRTVGMTTDITARKQAEHELRELSGKLITALEDERKRVARELHDGVSQSLALASMALESAATKPTVQDLRKSLKQVHGKVQVVLSDISRLSHQLHPSILDYMGLAPALAKLCHEVSQGSAVRVQLTEKNVPSSLASATALCLYRVAQEALQNIVKHSQATAASVQLTGADHELRLSVWDDGIGFDADSVSRGLGLISMRERLHLVGGTLRIVSQPGSGTRIEASVGHG